MSFKIGKINSLKITREEPQGFYLSTKNGSEVLLPNAYKNIKNTIGDIVEVFIYHDSEDRLVATTLMPYAKLNEFAYLEVVDTTNFGAFLDWGLPKQLFVPKKYQKSPFKIGERRVVKVVQDLQTSRLIGVERFGKFLSYKRPFYKINDKVKLFILAKTDLGFKAIINNNYEGMLYHNEIFCDLKIGDEVDGYIKQTRKDLKIDLSLSPIGKEHKKNDAKSKILSILRENNYALPYCFKTDSQTIEKVFSLSKKSFKSALSELMLEGAISVDENGIKLVLK